MAIRIRCALALFWISLVPHPSGEDNPQEQHTGTRTAKIDVSASPRNCVMPGAAFGASKVLLSLHPNLGV